MYQKKWIVLSVVLYLWIIVSTDSVFAVSSAPSKEVREKDHRNTLLDFLAPRGNQNCSGDPKLRSKRRDITFFTPIASVKHTDALRMVFKTYLAFFLATLRQGKPPLGPPFPKTIVRNIKDMLMN